MLPEGGKIVIDDSVHDPPVIASPLVKALRGATLFTTDINIKIVVGTLVTVALLTIAYLYQPLERPEHECLLDRSGVAELADPELTADDLLEARRVLLDKVRLSYGMSLEAFSALSWKDIETMIGDRNLYAFVRSGDHAGAVEGTIMEVTRWRRR
jgi:CBS-domain-containing membrane protein